MADRLLTVVICTHNRAADLERCLEGLVALDDEVAVIVVDSASNPPLDEVVDGFSSSLRQLTYHYEPEPGLSLARNRGLELARTELVAFLDDDSVPERFWARKLVAPFDDPGVVCVGGTCRAAFESERPPWLSDRLLQFAGVTRFGGDSRPARSSAEYPFGANVCFRRDALVELGGFSTDLGRIGTTLLSGEEHDVIERLRLAGGSIWLEPAAVVDHRVTAARCTSRYYWTRSWWQGVSRARTRRSARLGARLVSAALIRIVLWVVTGDRFYLVRTAETVGYLAECLPRPPALR
jgi:glycosyltransferase involved in cell wall biosynthesis